MKFSVADFPSGEPLIGYQIDSSRGLRVEEYRGRVGFEELRALWLALVSDPGWAPDHHVLVDLTEADLDLSANDVLRLSLLLRRQEFRSSGWQIFAVPAAAYGTVRMLGYWTRTTEKSRIFRTRVEAEEWFVKNAGSLGSGATADSGRAGFAPLALKNAG